MESVYSMSDVKLVDGLLRKFDRISLGKIKDAALMKRAETKYVMSFGDLVRVLPGLVRDYRVLEVDGKRRNSYATVYFDTSDFDLYKMHHNGCQNRYKIRTREYVDSNLSFVEVKFKDNKRKTTKSRVEVSGVSGLLGKSVRDFVRDKSGINFDSLLPVLYNHYSRVTLVGKSRVERLTIDFGLRFFDGDSERSVELSDLVIVEVKQERFSAESAFVQLMHENLIRPTSFSKYCIGVSLLYDDVKKNNFKEKLMLVNKMHDGGLRWM